MENELPIYSDPKLRTAFQFADIDKLRSCDATVIWEKSDAFIEQMEGAMNVAETRNISEISVETLLQVHAIIFRERDQAGALRQTPAKPLYRGHDCPDPQFIQRSLENFFGWLTAESIAEIHAVERAALVMTRIVDIWPFEFGNLTVAVIFGNIVLRDAGFSPFFVLPGNMKELNTILGQAITIETQPLVNAIHTTIKREMKAIAAK
jgi:hypothetical protein